MGQTATNTGTEDNSMIMWLKIHQDPSTGIDLCRCNNIETTNRLYNRIVQVWVYLAAVSTYHWLCFNAIFAANIKSRFCVRNALVSLSITTEASKDLKHTDIFCRPESHFPAQQHRYQTLTFVSTFASASQCFWIFRGFPFHQGKMQTHCATDGQTAGINISRPSASPGVMDWGNE